LLKKQTDSNEKVKTLLIIELSLFFFFFFFWVFYVYGNENYIPLASQMASVAIA
jgi:hypothetical protein